MIRPRGLLRPCRGRLSGVGVWCPCGEIGEHGAKHSAQPGCAVIVSRLGWPLVHMGGLGQFKLNRVAALFGAAIMAGGPAAHKTTVQDMRIALRLRAMVQGDGFQPWRAGCGAIGADIQVRQAPVKQERNFRADRMAVKQDDVTMQRLYAVQLRCQRSVIGGVPLRAPRCDFRRIGRMVPDIGPFEIGQRHQPGRVLAGIKTFAFRGTIGVDDLAVEFCSNDSHIRQHSVIKLRDMPVGIGQPAAGCIERRAH